jgi:hypothetical protein
MASEPATKVNANDAEEVPPVPASAEDRKAAAALSKLDARGDDDVATPAKEVDADALGKAMQNLSVGEGKGEKADAGKKVEEQKKKIKVDAADVALLVRPCESRVMLFLRKTLSVIIRSRSWI